MYANQILSRRKSLPRQADSTSCSYRSRFSNTLEMHPIPSKTSQGTVEVPNRLGSQERSNWIQSHLMNAAIRFLLYGFTYYLTLSSECFSTFPHGTCSLSVSLWYLALEQVYVPRWRSNLKLRYSKGRPCRTQLFVIIGLAPSMVEALIKGTHTNRHPTVATPNATMHTRSESNTLQQWAFAGSFAITKAISVDFFSFAY